MVYLGKKKPNSKINLGDTDVCLCKQKENVFLSSTDIPHFRDKDRSILITRNWVRTKSRIEILELWEKLDCTNFNSIFYLTNAIREIKPMMVSKHTLMY